LKKYRSGVPWVVLRSRKRLPGDPLLASDDAGFITGVTLPVDGDGWPTAIKQCRGRGVGVAHTDDFGDFWYEGLVGDIELRREPPTRAGCGPGVRRPSVRLRRSFLRRRGRALIGLCDLVSLGDIAQVLRISAAASEVANSGIQVLLSFSAWRKTQRQGPDSVAGESRTGRLIHEAFHYFVDLDRIPPLPHERSRSRIGRGP
jgi:hypothetical protein